MLEMGDIKSSPVVGDMVKFNPMATGKPPAGALTAMKYFARIESIVGNQIGVVLQVSDTIGLVLWHDNLIMGIPKKYLEVINESR